MVSGDAINVNSESSFQASVQHERLYSSSKRRGSPVLIFGAGAKDTSSARI
jgi:hypothetical protein